MRFALETSGLEEAERAELSAWPLEDASAAEGGELALPLAFLREAAPGSPLAACLLAAAEAAARSPAPPEIMGVLNVTPDSFSDGGRHLDPARAVEAGLAMRAAGAAWIDVGGESTRPGATPVPVEEERRRVVPVVEALRGEGLERVSIDTRRAAVAAAALEAGATLVNDVGAGLDDAEMLAVVRDAGCGWILMHRRGAPADMQRAPRYDDAVGEVADFLRRRAAAALEGGVAESKLWIDPGIGFGKGLEHNLELLARLAELRSIGLPLVVGPSRKSFIAHLTGAQVEADWRREAANDDPSLRIGGTAAAITFCVAGGAEVLRVHDVAVMAEARAVASAIAAHGPHSWPRPQHHPEGPPC